VYTDARWEKEKLLDGVGLILVAVDDQGQEVRLYAAGRCPEWLLARLREGGSDSIINELEFVAVLCAYLTFGKWLRGSRALHFIDNITALAAAVNGTACSAALRELVLQHAFALAALGVEVFGDWVPSGANSGDVPSRLDLGGGCSEDVPAPGELSDKAVLHAQRFRRIAMQWPREEDWGVPERVLDRLSVPRA
jgi:hypothetical protein